MIKLLLLFMPMSAMAGEIVFAPITAHLINNNGVASRYSGCLHKSCEVIYNPIFAYRSVNKYDEYYTSHTFMVGLNSIHDHMGGYYASIGTQLNSNRIGLVVGAYAQNNEHFHEQGIIPFAMYERNQTGIVPIIGVEHQFFFDKTVFSSAIITPVVANFGFGISF